ncbi:MAG: hypothetical protein ACRESE_06015 [Gammaproteobacteria bacterium]
MLTLQTGSNGSARLLFFSGAGIRSGGFAMEYPCIVFPLAVMAISACSSAPRFPNGHQLMATFVTHISANSTKLFVFSLQFPHRLALVAITAAAVCMKTARRHERFRLAWKGW